MAVDNFSSSRFEALVSKYFCIPAILESLKFFQKVFL